MGMVIIVGILLVIAFLAGTMFGYKGGVKETEARWSVAHVQFDHYHRKMLQQAHDEIAKLKADAAKVVTEAKDKL